MIRFRSPPPASRAGSTSSPLAAVTAASIADLVGPDPRRIGEILVEMERLDACQVADILQHQQSRGGRFGEVAADLQYLHPDDVVAALKRQRPRESAATTPHARELIVADDPYSTASETFRDLRSVLNLSSRSRSGRREALAVVSPNSRDGRTFVAANLAVAFGQLGRKTLLIDADMRRPRVHECFRLDNSRGLSDVLVGRASGPVVERVLDLPNVYVLPGGRRPNNPLELAESPALELVIDEFRNKFDQVIVDTPAVEFGADARVISSKCGAVLAVSRKGRTKQPALQAMVRWLQAGPSQISGMVLNDHAG